MNAVSIRRARGAGLIAVSLMVLLMGTPADAVMPAPKVSFASNHSTSESFIALPPASAPVTASDSDGGLLARTAAPGSTESGDAAASVNAQQTTWVRHSPAPVTGGYEMRRIRSFSRVSATVDRGTIAGPAANVSASTSSATEFTITNSVTMSFTIGQPLVQTDDSADCTKAAVLLRRQGQGNPLYRRTVQTPGCPAAPANIAFPTEPLDPGTYTLSTSIDGETQPSGTRVESAMRGRLDVLLTLGSGRLCSNILPTSAGATIDGTSGRDLLCGRSGPDLLRGFGGNDVLLGQGGGDTLVGAAGADILKPGKGADEVAGGDGNDVVHGCDNTKDTLRGQAGSDRVFRDAIDVISGFEARTAC